MDFIYGQGRATETSFLPLLKVSIPSMWRNSNLASSWDACLFYHKLNACLNMSYKFKWLEKKLAYFFTASPQLSIRTKLQKGEGMRV